MVEQDYNVKVTIRNGRLLARIRAAGHESVAAFCRAHGLTYTSVEGIVSLRETGMNSKEEWRRIVVTVSDILQCMPQDIVPEQHWRHALSKTSFELEMTRDQAAQLVGSHDLPDSNLIRQQLQDEIGALMRTHLRPREERVLRLRYGIDCEAKTLDEIGEVYGVQRERIRQIEMKALNKLKRHGRSNKLKPYFHDKAVME